jgi:hypothetical protein
MRLISEAFHQRDDEARLADTGLTGNQDNLAFAALCFRPAAQQQFELFFSPHKLRQCAGVQGLEAAFD